MNCKMFLHVNRMFFYHVHAKFFKISFKKAKNLKNFQKTFNYFLDVSISIKLADYTCLQIQKNHKILTFVKEI